MPTRDQICTKCLKVVKNLKRHELIHIPYSKRRFPCPWAGCPFAASQKAGLQVHINCIHTGEKPHVCPESECGFATGDSSRLTRHRKDVHGYAPAERENRNRRAVKVEDTSGDDGYIILKGAHAGRISMQRARPRRPLVNKGQEELQIPALPFSFSNVAASAYTPVTYDQPRVPVQHPMTVEYRFPASWVPRAQAPLTPACDETSIFEGYVAPHHNYMPAAYTCDTMPYPTSSQYHHSAVPRVFTGEPYAAANQGLGGWSCPQAAGYVDYGYITGAGVGGGAQWTQALPRYGVDTSFESPADGLLDAMTRCDMSSH
ncbi:hypothetical protein EV421DRAFT_1909531 [Armillaria borealis]|uniref:C2H2-type domain-containing protein n=1 Tax=Armillaria borealis TaxID=47425 RepID=A0AA39J2A5_9AGAR|nr:hypothetical protein EV421DRAFT_1909531 [Armillaria borealis]